jgi:hypothetical protein
LSCEVSYRALRYSASVAHESTTVVEFGAVSGLWTVFVAFFALFVPPICAMSEYVPAVEPVVAVCMPPVYWSAAGKLVFVQDGVTATETPGMTTFTVGLPFWSGGFGKNPFGRKSRGVPPHPVGTDCQSGGPALQLATGIS